MSPRPVDSPAPGQPPHRAVAFAVHASRNFIVQVVGVGMVVLTCLNLLPWPLMAGWTAIAVTVLAIEDGVLRAAAARGGLAGAARIWAPALRIGATSLYALAALAMIARGGPAERLFAFALISASMVNVLMRYYRSPRMLIGALAPYVGVLGFIAFFEARIAFNAGHPLAVLVCGFTLATFGLQFWSARGQLSAAWDELMSAREAAEEREQAAEAANRAKSNFLATMSHELRTPLNGVLGMAQALTTDHLTKEQHERVRVIRRSSESLLAVLNDLLDLSKIEANVLELEIVEFDLEHLVRGVVAAYRPLADRKGLAFNFDISDAVRGRYKGDSARIRRILYSLIDNAVKFTEAGAVTLSVSREAGAVAFQVSDTGIGISAEDLTHLFEGFYQVDAGRTRRFGGAGLGLAICHEMTHLMGGDVEAISEPGHGATFVVRLPLAAAVAHAEPDPAERPAPERSAPGDLRVLAAEDNDTNQLVLKTLLGQVGIVPTLVENGWLALEAWEGQHWDVILMDIQMPVMDGVEATRAIRARETETKRPRTPILAVTANAMTHQVSEYRAAGVDGMVPKPIDIAALFQAMEQAMEPVSDRDDAQEASAA